MVAGLTSDEPLGVEGHDGRRDAASPARSILLVAPSWPHPPTWGLAARVYNLPRHLSARHDFALPAFGAGDVTAATNAAEPIFQSVQFVPHPGATRSKRRAQATSLLSSRSYHVGSLRSASMQSAFERLLS